ncbi:ParB family protein [Orbus mooreae]|uniref:ParB family protein n=1 Tax=Orbus mooreae TaxID=3074107 RepID=UPI00370DBAE8
MSEITNNNVEQLLANNFNKAGRVVDKLSDPIVDTPMSVTLEQLKPYDHNPRTTRNPKYKEIKSSIRERGLDAPPQITRRPGEGHYIIRNGGNTRLSILWELWQETQEERFFRIHTLFRPWQSEIIALTGHLAESDLHGRLKYIERAQGVMKAAEIYHQELGVNFTQVQLAKKLTHDGYPISQTTISQMQEAINFILPVIPDLIFNLSRNSIEKILRLRKIAKSVWQKHSKSIHGSEQSYTFDNLFVEVLSVFNTQTQEIDLTKYQDELIGRIANIFECHYELIELEFTEKLVRQRSLEAPSTVDDERIDADFDEASLFATKVANLKTLDTELDEHQILAISAPKRPLSQKLNNITQRNLAADATPNNYKNTSSELTQNSHNPLDLDTTREDASFLPPMSESVETTPRLAQIQQLIEQYNHHLEPESGQSIIQAIAVQAGSLYPISDIWSIPEELNHLDELRKAIGLLLTEIVQAVSDELLIVQSDEALGFQCIQSSSASPSAQILIDLLSTLYALPLSIKNDALLNLISLLTGLHSENTGVVGLDDTNFIKLMRVFRLIRQHVELTK